MERCPIAAESIRGACATTVTHCCASREATVKLEYYRRSPRPRVLVAASFGACRRALASRRQTVARGLVEVADGGASGYVQSSLRLVRHVAARRSVTTHQQFETQCVTRSAPACGWRCRYSSLVPT